ncbi:unnamed protein product [Sphagnum jensenii]|uniref:Uncharacterized protein n=1 Tax=Sphagnum jensenii TaxID=128206 RepID=A0ABP0V6D6_9BRYO
MGAYGLLSNGPVYKLPLSYYLNLFTSEYQTCPNFLSWAAASWQPIDDLTSLLSTMPQNFNLNSAVGVQLDTIGAIIGVSRTVNFQPSNGVSPVLNDVVYKQLLQATIGINKWDGRLVSIYDIWKSVFSSGEIVVNDNQNMTCTIIIAGVFSSIVLDLITNGYIIPRPQGVEYTYTTAPLPIFGADLNNAYVAGADLGHAF